MAVNLLSGYYNLKEENKSNLTSEVVSITAPDTDTACNVLLVISWLASICHCAMLSNMRCVTRKQTLRSLSFLEFESFDFIDHVL